MRHTHHYIKAGAWFSLTIGLAVLIFFGLNRQTSAAPNLDVNTPTETVPGNTSGRFITVTYIEPINVRTGPSSFDYPVVGTLPVGGTAPAIGRSPAGEWIQIEFADAPRGKGWVYAANVTLSPGGSLPIVEPPPTPTPVETPTFNLTYVAAFQTIATSTRLPTYTAPPSLVIPAFTNRIDAPGNRIAPWVIIVLGLIGIIGIILTSFRRH